MKEEKVDLNNEDSRVRNNPRVRELRSKARQIE
jgi:hypothetical protein